MAIAHVRQNGNGYISGMGSNPVYSVALTVSTAASGGDTCILTIGFQLNQSNNPPTASSVSDSRGNTWTIDANAIAAPNASTSFGPIIASGFMASPLQAGDTVTVTFNVWSTASITTFAWAIDEFSGIASSGRVDKSNTVYNANTQIITPALSTATTNPGDLIFANGCWWGSGGTITGPGGSWVAVPNLNTQGIAIGASYYLPGTTGAFSAQFAWTTSTNAAGCIASYKPGVASNFFAFL